METSTITQNLKECRKALQSLKKKAHKTSEEFNLMIELQERERELQDDLADAIDSIQEGY